MTQTMLIPTLKSAMSVANIDLLVSKMMSTTMPMTHGDNFVISSRAWSAEYPPIKGLPP